MKKNTKHLVLGLIAGIMSISAMSFLSTNLEGAFANRGHGGTMSCEEYWNDDYTSLYEITHDSNNVDQTFTTWGTVSEVFVQNSKTNFFIQSTDEYGRKAGALVYQADQSVATTVEVGNVVSVTGDYNIYNGCNEFMNATLEIDHTTNTTGPIVPLHLTNNYWDNENRDNMRDQYNDMYGYIDEVKIDTNGSSFYAEFSNGDVAPLNVKSNLGTSETSDIRNKLDNLCGRADYDVRVNGIFEYYEKNSTKTMQLQILHADDVIGEVEEVLVTSVSLNCNELELELNETYQLEATVLPNNATNKTLFWESNDEDVVTVSTNGLVTAVGAGTTYVVVQATDGSGYYDYCRVEVTYSGSLVQSVEFNKDQLTLEVGETETLIATVLPVSALNKTLTWSSSNDSVVSVNQNGLVTANALGTAYVYADTTDGSNLYAACEVHIVEQAEYETVVFDLSTVNPGSYSTGNYKKVNIAGTQFVCYRATTGMNLLPIPAIAQNYGDGGVAGSIRNVQPIGGIHSITINYSTQYSSGNNPVIQYGASLNYGSIASLPFSTSERSYVLETANTTQYFAISCGDCKLKVTDITVEYDSVISSYTPALINPMSISTRINPTTYSGTLVPGESQVTVPFKGSTKTFTYYTEEYVAEHTECTDDAALLTPEDISAYVIAFREWPANVMNVSSNSEVFGSLTRKLSPKYTRTDGYAASVPYSVAEYYEIDIALDSSYTVSNRGVGRVVVWMYGFDWTGYDSNIVCTYTDDHYATFQEYANNGYFMTRFNGEQPMTQYSRVA